MTVFVLNRRLLELGIAPRSSAPSMLFLERSILSKEMTKRGLAEITKASEVLLYESFLGSLDLGHSGKVMGRRVRSIRKNANAARIAAPRAQKDSAFLGLKTSAS